MNIIPEYKAFFIPNKGNDGIYLEIYGKFRTSKASDNTYGGIGDNVLVTGKTDVSTSAFGLGAMLGYKWKTSGALFLEVTGGIGKFIANSVKFSDATVEKLTDAEFNSDDYIPYIGNTLKVDLRLAVKIGIRLGGGSE